MYNRYIPQSDGSFQRSRIPETAPPPPPPKPPMPPTGTHTEQPKPPQEPCIPREAGPYTSIGSFFRQLLPRELDAADLMIILLLLLMSEGCQERKNHALLTLALYFFM